MNESRRVLSEPECAERLSAIPEWRVQDGKLHREYTFADFVQAFSFMTAAAFGIEKRNHHPNWLNVYNRVTVDLFTHDAQGITAKDLDLAQHLDKTAAYFL